jgi:hypothetical protein
MVKCYCEQPNALYDIAIWLQLAFHIESRKNIVASTENRHSKLEYNQLLHILPKRQLLWLTMALLPHLKKIILKRWTWL